MTSDRAEPRRRFSWPLAMTLIALTGAALLFLVFLRLETWPARTAKQGTAELERVGREVRDAFVAIGHLQPRITINNRVYVEKTTTTAQLTTLSRQIEVEHELLHTWAGSTKRVKLHGTFEVRAGFDLSQDVAVDVRPDAIVVQLPHATLLGLEQKQVDVLAFENGFWNRISAEDLENELSALPQLARERATDSGLLAEAETGLQQQLGDRIHTSRPLQVIFGNAAPKD